MTAAAPGPEPPPAAGRAPTSPEWSARLPPQMATCSVLTFRRMLGNGTRMRDQAIGGYLDMLAARVAAPGGGAVAALQCAMAAALLTMAALFSDRPRHAGFQGVIGPIPPRAA